MRVAHQEATWEYFIYAPCPACVTLSFELTAVTLAATLCRVKMCDKSLCTWPRKKQILTTLNCVITQEPSRASRQLMIGTTWAAGSGLGVRQGYLAFGSLGFLHVAHLLSPKPLSERKALSANSLQSKCAKEWQKGSILCISMFSKGLTPELLSPEAVRRQHLLKQAYRTLWKVLASIATFPRHSSGQIRNLFSKNLSAKEFRSQSL